MSTINFNGLQSLEKEGNKMQNSHKLSMMTMTALFAAMISVLAQIVIPLPLIPMTGQTFAIGLAGTILGSRHGLSATVLYVLMGCIGIPVFAQMTGGLGILFGPTGGFIIGFIPATWLIGYYLEDFLYVCTSLYCKFYRHGRNISFWDDLAEIFGKSFLDCCFCK